jgi:erythromycin esterase
MNHLLSNFLLVLAAFSFSFGADPVASAQVPSGDLKEVIKLEFGKPIEREIAGTDSHSYYITLLAGQFLRAVVDQRGIDVIVTVIDPDGKKLAEIDSPNGTEGPEPVAIEARSSGSYRLEIKPAEKDVAPGRYQVKIEEILSPEEYANRLAAERSKLDTVKSWLSRNAIRLQTVEAGSGFTDMEPLKKLIGNAHLVSLGEATHGTREFFQLKHRMLEFLVSEMDFTVFGIEAPMPEAFDINEYVVNGNGDPEKALAGLYFWTWDTQEVLDMIHWMRHYNQDPSNKKKVKFYGFDMQHSTRATRVMLKYLRTVDPEQASTSERELAMLTDPFLNADFENLPRERKEEMVAFTNELLTRFDDHKAEYVKHTGGTEWAIARQHAQILSQNLKMRLTPDQSFAIRDSAMAENIRWILQFEGGNAKMLAWAHNGHVSTQSYGSVKNMGTHLREMFGPEMRVFGFAFNQGSFQAVEMPFPSSNGLHSFTIGAAPDGSLDAMLAQSGLSLAAIDLHSLPKEGAVAEWFSIPHGTRDIGAGYSDQAAAGFLQPQVLPALYDALFFIEKTTSARPVEGGSWTVAQRLPTPANLDFESSEAGKPPIHWVVPSRIAGLNFQVVTSTDNPRSGERCAMISAFPGKKYGETSGRLQQTIDAVSYRGKKIELRAAVRVQTNAEGDKAYLWLRISKQGVGPQALAFYENMADRPITSDKWREYEIVADVPVDAETISYGLTFTGEGQAWLDAVSIQVVHK